MPTSDSSQATHVACSTPRCRNAGSHNEVHGCPDGRGQQLFNEDRTVGCDCDPRFGPFSWSPALISPINLGFHITGKQNSQPGASDRGGTGPLIACLRGPTAAPAVARAPLVPEVTARVSRDGRSPRCRRCGPCGA